MKKNLLISLSIFIISFIFTTNSYAVILENMPTSTQSVQPIPKSVIFNMSNNFDINSYNIIRQNKIENPTENQETSSSSVSEIIKNQNLPTNKNNHQIFWYLVIFLVLFIVFIFLRRNTKTNNNL